MNIKINKRTDREFTTVSFHSGKYLLSKYDFTDDEFDLLRTAFQKELADSAQAAIKIINHVIKDHFKSFEWNFRKHLEDAMGRLAGPSDRATGKKRGGKAGPKLPTYDKLIKRYGGKLSAESLMFGEYIYHKLR